MRRSGVAGGDGSCPQTGEAVVSHRLDHHGDTMCAGYTRHRCAVPKTSVKRSSIRGIMAITLPLSAFSGNVPAFFGSGSILPWGIMQAPRIDVFQFQSEAGQFPPFDLDGTRSFAAVF